MWKFGCFFIIDLQINECFRHVKLEAELAEMNWRVKWEDIMFGTMEGDRRSKKQQGSNLSLARVSN